MNHYLLSANLYEMAHANILQLVQVMLDGRNMHMSADEADAMAEAVAEQMDLAELYILVMSRMDVKQPSVMKALQLTAIRVEIAKNGPRAGY